MSFEEELSRGNLTVCVCQTCGMVIWPPSGTCSMCRGATKLKACPKVGTILGFASKNGEYFCLAEFGGGVRIMGSLGTRTRPRVGQKVRLEQAGIRDGAYHFEMSIPA